MPKLSLCGRADYDQTGRMQFCWFCHDATQIVSTQSNKQCSTATLFCYLSRTYRVLSREYIALNILTTAVAELVSIHIQAASVAEWLRPRIFSGLNHTFCRKRTVFQVVMGKILFVQGSKN